jgi:hypothetical protein
MTPSGWRDWCSAACPTNLFDSNQQEISFDDKIRSLNFVPAAGRAFGIETKSDPRKVSFWRICRRMAVTVVQKCR